MISNRLQYEDSLYPTLFVRNCIYIADRPTRVARTSSHAPIRVRPAATNQKRL